MDAKIKRGRVWRSRPWFRPVPKFSVPPPAEVTWPGTTSEKNLFSHLEVNLVYLSVSLNRERSARRSSSGVPRGSRPVAIARWTYLITSDITNASYQILLGKESMKYCGIATPFRGTLVFACSAIGMPGSETTVDELMCRILGDLIQEGYIVKIVGGDSPPEQLHNWCKVFATLAINNTCLASHLTKHKSYPRALSYWDGYGGKVSFRLVHTACLP